MASYDTLLGEARGHFGVKPAVTCTDAISLLESLGAVAFSFDTHRDDLIDEFVDPSLVIGAYTLAQPSLLRRRATPEEKENFTASPNDTFDPLEYGAERAEWTLLAREIETLARLVVVLERDPESEEFLGNFRVYGAGQWLRETLWAASGVVPRDPGEPSAESELFGRAFAYVGRERFVAAQLP
ncbi:hypothetical protein [Arthrobacter sp. HLT1-20]